MSTAFEDADFPAYTMGRAAEILGVTPAFLRSLGTAGLIQPERSHGGHRRYSRHQLQLAARVRQLQEAVKLAREQANMAEVTDLKIADPVLGFVFGNDAS